MKNEMITVNNTDIQIKEWNGERVVTFKEIDAVHGRKEGTAKRRFDYNKKRLVKGKDYYIITSKDLDTTEKRLRDSFKNLIKSPRGLTFLTESGYLMIVKTMDDDVAWKVQRRLIDVYFKAKEIETNIIHENNENNTLLNDKLMSTFLNMMREDREKYMSVINSQADDISQLKTTVVKLESLLNNSLNVISADRAVFSDVMNKQHKMIVDLVEKSYGPRLDRDQIHEYATTAPEKNLDAASWKQNINDLLKVVCDETGRDKNMVLSDSYKMMKSLYGIDINTYQREYHATIKTPRCPSMFETICWMETSRDTSLNGTMERILWSMIDDLQGVA